jgi:hypothetical protein
MNLSTLTSQLKNPKYYFIYARIVFCLLLLGGSLYLGFQAYDNFTQYDAVNTELNTARDNANLIRNNEQILSANIDSYNELLGNLIPDQESYFQVILALENLATKTGVNITSYSIDLTSTTENKLTLQVDIEGTEESLENLLKEYMFISGRLLTNENVTISKKDDGKMKFSINFYHSLPDGSASNTEQVTQKDLEFLDSIKQKM